MGPPAADSCAGAARLPRLANALPSLPPPAVLPWAHLQGPLPEATLLKHLLEAQEQMRGSQRQAADAMLQP